MGVSGPGDGWVASEGVVPMTSGSQPGLAGQRTGLFETDPPASGPAR